MVAPRKRHVLALLPALLAAPWGSAAGALPASGGRTAGAAGAAGAIVAPGSGAPAFQLVGRPGSFGDLTTTLPGGAALSTVGVTDWSFLPGQAAYTTVVAADGTLLIANEPQSDVQTRPTASTMAVSSYNPGTGRFATITVPTSTGRSSVVAPGSTAGGADVGGIALTRSGTPVFVSGVPYHGWDAPTMGQYPSIGFLEPNSGPGTGFRYARGLTGDALAARSPVAACTVKAVLNDCKGPADMVAMPGGGFVIAQYFGDGAGDSGSLLLVDDAGTPLHRLGLPLLRQADGRTSALRPRLVVADPRAASTQSLAVVFDVTDGERGLPGVLAEYTVADGQIAQVSGILAPSGTEPIGWGYEYASYDGLGNLWVAEAVSNTLRGGAVGAFPARAGMARGALRRSCRAPGAATAIVDVRRCSPPVTTTAAAGSGLVRSMVADPRSGDMIVSTLSGYLQALRPVGQPITAINVSAPIDLGLDRLVDRTRLWIGPRQGALDARTGMLWFPIQQLRSPALCPAGSCDPAVADQWVYGVDLATAGFSFAAAATRRTGVRRF